MKSLVDIFSNLHKKHSILEPDGMLWLSFSDKGSSHSYIEFYEKYLGKKHKKVDLLEIGIATGGSMLMWTKYFEEYNLVGLDINSTWYNNYEFTKELDIDPKITIHWNVNSRKPLASLILNTQLFDFIIDDGDHAVLAQEDTFINFYNHLRPGGTYFIEDVSGDTQQASLIKWLQKVLNGTEYTLEVYEGLKNGRQDDRIIAVSRGIIQNRNSIGEVS